MSENKRCIASISKKVQVISNVIDVLVFPSMFRSSHFSFLVFGHFWQSCYEIKKILCNLSIHFARQDGKDGKNRKENHKTKVTKITKTKR